LYVLTFGVEANGGHIEYKNLNKMNTLDSTALDISNLLTVLTNPYIVTTVIVIIPAQSTTH